MSLPRATPKDNSTPPPAIAPVEPTATEQYMLELVNWARLHPQSESQRQGIDLNESMLPGAIAADPKQPLVFDRNLVGAARAHSDWMLATESFSRAGAGGSTGRSRIEASGYQFSGGGARWAENIAIEAGNSGARELDYVNILHRNLFASARHRENLMFARFKEIGIGISSGPFDGLDSVAVSQKFATADDKVYLTGVVFADDNSDAFYTPGEGLGNVTVRVATANGTTVTSETIATGGYQIALSPGRYRVTFAGDVLSEPIAQPVQIPQQNYKLDLVLDEDGQLASLRDYNQTQSVQALATPATGAFGLTDLAFAGVLVLAATAGLRKGRR